MTVLKQNTPIQYQKSITVALAGQPNVGKSTVFNMLTGLNQHVGNWPGKTVEFKTGELVLNETLIHLIDLPGTYSLTSNSEEERITRDFIIREKPDVVIAIVNAAMLERNLYLVAELLALDVPFVLGLNMIDVANQQGLRIEVNVLEAALRVPVVPVIASKNQGLKELIDTAQKLVESPIPLAPNRPEIRPEHRLVLEEICSLITGLVPQPYHEDWVALKLLEGDSEVMEMVEQAAPKAWPRIQALLSQHEDAILDITGGRYEWIARMVRAAVVRPRPGTIVLTDRLDRIVTHPFWGLVLLFGILGIVFWLTYHAAMPVVDWLGSAIIIPLANVVSVALANAPLWFSGLIVNGLIGGVGTVLTFLPILIVFFIVLGVLEDIGYLTRAAYVMDRFMHWMGLHGRSFLPLFLGFGCNVPAVMGTRIVEDRRARLLTILLVPFVPCAARLAVVSFLTPAFFGTNATLVTWLLVIGNLTILVMIGIAINRFLFKGAHTAFIMEIPLYHVPNARTIGLYVWQNMLAFLKKAGVLIVIISVIVWAFSWLPAGNVNNSLLAGLGRWLEPLGRLMGLNDWRLIVALLTSFVAKENTIATLGVLYGISDHSGGLAARVGATLTPAAGLSFLVVQMLFIPCVATIAVIKQETASWKWTAFSVILLLTISMIAGIGVYQLAILMN
ncbi:MAG: ferrous iron transport protein B [Anaerolineaceae bacterium]|nr:ferrous iron transport protein B [Anaerolineaceae bacterium]